MRILKSDDDFVFPPSELMTYTCGHSNFDEYKRSGFEVSTMLQLALKKHTNLVASDMQSILDFGCGSGRILSSMFFGGASVCACDVGDSVSSFSQTSFPSYDVRRTNLLPPLPWEDSFFDLNYSFSVFSHLPKDVENIWLTELHRVTKPGGVVLATVHGDWFIEATLPKHEQELLTVDGFMFKHCHQRVGIASEMPDYYETSYHTSKYIREVWSEYFDVIDIFKGDNPKNYLFDNLRFVSEGGEIPDFRPMGQCLIVLKRAA